VLEYLPQLVNSISQQEFVRQTLLAACIKLITKFQHLSTFKIKKRLSKLNKETPPTI
jgi:hypothetical protein